MERRPVDPKDAFPVRAAHVGQSQLPAWIRNADLAAVQVPRERERIGPRRYGVDDLREVAEKDAERRSRVHEPLGASVPGHVRARAHPRDLDADAAGVEGVGRVAEQNDARLVEVSDLARLAEGVAALGHIVVPEHGVGAMAGAKPREAPAERRLAARMCEEIARRHDHVRIAALGPRDGAPERKRVQPQCAQVEVREVKDPKAVQLRRKAGDLNVELDEVDPLRLEERPRERRRRAYGGDPEGGDWH